MQPWEGIEMRIGLPVKTLFIGTVLIGLLSGCVTTGKGPGSLLSASLAATPAGQQLNQYALGKAVSAEVSALDATPAGGAKDWRSGKAASGRVSPGPPFEVSGRICRRFTHQITVEGVQSSITETACKNEEDVWQPVGS